MDPVDIIWPLQHDRRAIVHSEGDEGYAPMVKNVRTFQAGLFQNLIRIFPAYGTYFKGAYYVSTLMGEGGLVHVHLADRSIYSIEIGLIIPNNPKSRVAQVQTMYDFSGAGDASPQSEEFQMSLRNLLIGINGEFNNIIEEMTVGTSFVSEGGVDYLGRPGDSLSHNYEIVQVYQYKPDGYGVAYSQIGYRRF